MDVNMNSIMGYPTDTIYSNGFNINPIILIIIVIVLILYYAVFNKFGKNSRNSANNSGKPNKSITFLEVLLWGIFIILIMMNALTYFYNMDITASINNLFSSEPNIDIIVDQEDLAGDTSPALTTVPEIKIKKQVYHIPDNKYSYSDAKAVCNAYGGRLATWKQINKAFKKGADWCGMGWSDGQMALYPTQYDKWENLQKIKGHENDCGRPGINGGYIDNPNVRFGINCFGYKPKITQDEAEAMKLAPLYPKTKKELLFEKKVDYWRQELPNITVSPFNHNSWSSI
tara:strand:- start:881 stop:1738 length:858 start_codon:yes stop_codon:yes gene_type:complete